MSKQDLSSWQPCAAPGTAAIAGAYCVLEPFDPDQHGAGLFSAVAGPDNDGLWAYIPMGPYTSSAELNAVLAHVRTHLGWQTMVIKDAATNSILGMASYMRQRPEHGSVEVGCIVFSPALKRTRMATEAIYLMARHAFDDLGYRRFEWKCNAANEASKSAAVRFGFTFEGIFRNDMVIKGANRDTAWYSIIGSEWTDVKAGFRAWLQADNFDESGGQRKKLVMPTKS